MAQYVSKPALAASIISLRGDTEGNLVSAETSRNFIHEATAADTWQNVGASAAAS